MKQKLILLAVCLLVLSLSACGKKTKPDEPAGDAQTDSLQEDDASDAEESEPLRISPNGVTPIVNETVAFEVLCRQSDEIPDMEENLYVRWLEEQTGVHIDYDMIPADTTEERIDRLMASGLYPDALQAIGLDRTRLVRYGSQGDFVDLSPYYEAYGFYVVQAYKDSDYLPRSITTPDGRIYCITGLSNCPQEHYPGRAWINQTWLAALGLSAPNTTEELRTVLEAFRDNDCNGNGNPADEVPMIGVAEQAYGNAADWLLEAYMYDDYDMLVQLYDGHVRFNPITDAYQEGLLLMRDWVENGLIDAQFLDTTEEEAAAIGAQEVPTIGLMVSPSWTIWFGDRQIPDDQNTWRERQYAALANVSGPDNERNTLSESEQIGNELIITAACSHPEILFRWADYQLSKEASVRAYAGSYEKSVAYPNADALGIDQEPALYKMLKSPEKVAALNETCRSAAIAYLSPQVRLGRQTDWEDPETVYNPEVRLYSETVRCYKRLDASEKRVPTLVMDEADTERRIELEAPIRDYTRDWMREWILGEKDPETEWEEYLEGYKELQLTPYIELLDKYYQTQKTETGGNP